MATPDQGSEPDFLRMDAGSVPASPVAEAEGTAWKGWPSRNGAEARVVLDDKGRVTRVRTPIMELDGLMTPTDLFYTVQHFAVPEVVSVEDWRVQISGAVQNPVSLTFDDLRRLPARTVRTVMECSGSDANFLSTLKAKRPVRHVPRKV